jgi:hypothetical protein
MKQELVMSVMSEFRHLVLGLVAAACVLFAGPTALADKLHLKDGRVLDGTIVRQGEGFVFFRVVINGVAQEQLFTSDQISKIERTSDAAPGTGDAAKDAKPADANAPASNDAAATKDSGEAKAESTSVVTKPGVTRVAVLNFGPPSSWKGEVESMVGGVIQAKHWDQAVPLLKKDKVDVVVVRVNSGGGALLELERFHRVFIDKYKPNFRTVAWIESAISAAAMSPWVLDEFYFMPDGNMGACTAFSGGLDAMKGFRLESLLLDMERAGEVGKRPSPYIMRAMQIQEPLSVDIDEQGNVIWRQDEAGQHVLNRANRVFTINANDAIKFNFARGKADTMEELVKAMGIQEWEPAGKAATDLIDRTMRDADSAEKRFRNVATKYLNEIAAAEAQQDRTRRGEFLGMARRSLAEIKRLFKDNWLASVQLGIDEDWIREQERRIRDLGAP